MMRQPGSGYQTDYRQTPLPGGPRPEDSEKDGPNQYQPPQENSLFARISPKRQGPDPAGPPANQQGQYLPNRGEPSSMQTNEQQQKPPMQQQQQQQQPAGSRMFGVPPLKEPESKEPPQQQSGMQRPPYPQQPGSYGQPQRRPPPQQPQQGGGPYGQMPPQQRPPPGQPNPYGGQYNAYGQQTSPYGSTYGGPQGYGQQQQRQVVPQEKPDAVRETFGKTWQGILGWSNRTKEAFETTRQNVAANAKEATQNLQSKSTSKSFFPFPVSRIAPRLHACKYFCSLTNLFSLVYRLVGTSKK